MKASWLVAMVPVCIQAVKVLLRGNRLSFWPGILSEVGKGLADPYKGKVICGCVLSG